MEHPPPPTPPVEALLWLKLPPLPWAQGKGCSPDSKAVTPSLPLKENHMAGGDIKAGEFTVGSHPSLRVCAECCPGVLHGVNVNWPVIIYFIPVWVILTDDGYFICFPPQIGCCKADLEVTVRTSVSWESSDCSTGANDCNIGVWLRSPPGC